MSQSGPKAILYDEAGAALVGSKVSASSLPVVIASDQAAIPTSAASLPLPTGAATSALQTSGGQKTQVVDASGNIMPAGDVAARANFNRVTDGTNTAAVKAASTAPVAADPALVVAISPNTPSLSVITTGRTVVGRYGVSTGRITGAAAAQNLVSIENPALSGKTLYIRKIKISASCVAAAIVNFQLRLGRTTATPTAGTAQTAQKRATADATPVGIVRSGPTATAATGTIWAAAGPSFQNNPTVYASEVTAWDSEGDPSIDINLVAGEGLLVSAEANDVDFNFTVSFEWGEA